jgi:hypothetical protein
MQSLKEKLQKLQYYFERHLTTITKSLNLDFSPASSDGSIGQSSWIQFVRRALSRQTKIQDSGTHLSHHLTTEPKLRKINKGQESSDGYVGQGSWKQMVGRTWSRRPKFLNTKITARGYNSSDGL